MNEYKSTSFIPRERIEKRGREGLDGRVWGHWIVRGDAFCEPTVVREKISSGGTLGLRMQRNGLWG